MDELTHPLTDRKGRMTTSDGPPTLERLAAERACDDLLQRIEHAAGRALAADRRAGASDDESLPALVREYAGCAHAAGMRPEQMVRPLKVAMSRFFYERREHADELLRVAVLRYFDIAPDLARPRDR